MPRGCRLAGLFLAGLSLLSCTSRRQDSARQEPARQESAGESGPYVVPSPSRAAAPAVVTIVVDQLAAWIAEERFPLLPADGGFARLRSEGTWVTRMELAHASTGTAPGHAALYTGVPPGRSGIVANDVCGEKGEQIGFLRDPSASAILPSGERSGPSASLARLHVPVLADRLRAARPDAMIVSLSLKDRAALMGAGRTPDAAVWWDKGLDSFVTSTAVAGSFPAWARDLGSTAALAALRREPWTLLDESWVRAHALTPDDQPGEGDLGGFGTVFPHDFARAERPANAFRASPAADAAILALALAALDARRPGVPVLLALSLSANDYVGHAFGPDSWEAWDHLLRLDAALAAFFRALDARFGPDGWSAVLSADHGVSSMPEVKIARPWCTPGAPPDPYGRPCSVLPRIDGEVLDAELRATAEKTLGPGRWVLCFADPFVHLSSEAQALPDDRRHALFDALEAQLVAHEQVGEVVRTDELPSDCPPDTDASVSALICRSIDRAAPPALYVALRREALLDTDVAPGKGSNHGTPYAFNYTVPLLVRAPGAVRGGRVIRTPVPYQAFSATAASLLGLAPD
jgi:hypothetical protein